jgi:xylulose-5-phosphate/fructose-6-phosphate phosphoketolase
MRLGCPRNQSEHKVYISRYGDDMPDIKGWTRGQKTLAQRTGSTEADNV